MTYAQLLKKLNQLTPEELAQDVRVLEDGYDEPYLATFKLKNASKKMLRDMGEDDDQQLPVLRFSYD